MTRRDDGRWVDTITLPNGKRKYIYGKTKQEVNRKMREFQEQEELAGSIGFTAAAQEFRRSVEDSLSYNTLQNYDVRLRRVCLFFGDRDIRTIKPKDISDFANWYIHEYNPAKRTLNFAITVLSLIFRYAVTCGYIDADPTRDVILPKNLKVGFRDVPTDDEVKTVLSRQDLILCRMFLFALYTGLRIGEMIALTWDDIDMERREISVSKSASFIGAQSVIKEPKTKNSIRTVSVPDFLYETLSPESGYVFKGRSGGIITKADLQVYEREFRKKTGLSCTAHQFRHAYATMLYDSGIDIKDSQRLLGHADSSTTLNIYTHIRESREKKINDKIRGIQYSL